MIVILALSFYDISIGIYDMPIHIGFIDKSQYNIYSSDKFKRIYICV
jgi:hypothetical protein